MYYSIIGILAILVLFIVNRDIIVSRKGPLVKPVWKTYRRFLFTVLVYYVTDVVWGVLEYYKLAVPLFADTVVYFVAMAAGIWFWAAYTVAYLEDRSPFGRTLVIAGGTLAVTFTIMSIVNIFRPVLFTVDAAASTRRCRPGMCCWAVRLCCC